MTIGIGITTHNRYEVFKQTYEKVKEFLPEGAKLVVVDDASDIPVKEATFRFHENVGIAVAKNACLALLEDCDYIFLLDDDTYPKVPGWHLPYISSGLNHAMMIFPRLADGTSTNNQIIKKVGRLIYYRNPCGNMLFMTRKCLEVVGGMDSKYGRWGGEHQGYSERIYNNGLIPHPFIDIENSTSLFYSHDYYQTCERSVPKEIRKQCIKKIMPKLNSEKYSKEFIPYKKMTGRVVTTYLIGHEDPQRGAKWNLDTSILDSLCLSLKDRTPITVIADWTKYKDLGQLTYWETESKMNPYLQRWVSILEYLKWVHEDYVFCVDATDVEMLTNPFHENMGNYLWVGDEPSTIQNEWLIKHHWQPLFEKFFRTHANKPLLNAGVLGGRKIVVEAFLKRMVWYIENHEIKFSDMALFNFVLYTEFPELIRHGRKVTTVFKSYDQVNKHGSWWRHK